MKLTHEQTAVVQAEGSIKINAVAGSGKTTTVIEYAKTRPSTSKILYLAFNKSVRLEAIQRFGQAGLKNVKVETAHSLAFKYIVPKYRYTVAPFGYKIHEVATMLGLTGNGDRHSEYIIAGHVLKLTSLFCNSTEDDISKINYPQSLSEKKSRTFAQNYIKDIQKFALIFLNKMDDGEIDVTHDFYLKKFQLSSPILNYDYILFDEGQDASPAMLHVFLAQKAIKLIVGDTHQQIYAWRSAVNSLEQTKFPTFSLSESFRFGEDIAQLASHVLDMKELIGNYKKAKIIGAGKKKQEVSYAVIARTNLGLLLKAIEHIIHNPNLKHLYFEGNIHSYTYAEDGASLYDILHLFNRKRFLIRDPLIKSMRSMSDLYEYIDKTEDSQLSMMTEIVKQYGNEIPNILKKIKALHVENHEKHKAQIVFSTVHRCKGMEYDTVELVPDFITEEKILKCKKGEDEEKIIEKLNEEINLLYVAVTRATCKIILPEEYVPEALLESLQIKAIKSAKLPEENTEEFLSEELEDIILLQEIHQKTYTYDEVRKKHASAYMPWTDDLDRELQKLLLEGSNIRMIASRFGRTDGSVRSRIRKLQENRVSLL
jgi:F-box protein, helicase, 18